MTDETKKHAPDDKKETQNGFDEAREAAEAALGEEDQPFGDEIADNGEALTILVDGLKSENADLKDKYLRLAAEMDNLRRRTARDVKDAKSYAIANFARDMLAVSDNLRRALDAIPDEQRQSDDAGFNSLVEGVEMTERAMLSAMERHGVRKQEPEGQKFDPNFHQAMFEVPNTDVANNTVVQVVQDGYVIGERVLRPAMVGVSKGGPKQSAEAAAEGGAAAQSADGEAEPGAPNAQSEKDA
ncbi:nucleotide exchange factor GrpE [Pararhizobium haloflavum]|uniref:nucleotide exchange factor GrpE n=1 Tax=Pararhizobium haloflavum TaxID=2037914 RepID=UPI000C197729|nr:nucleotide exchange factor GrpE [Pararhizobium haloflavum]